MSDSVVTILVTEISTLIAASQSARAFVKDSARHQTLALVGTATALLLRVSRGECGAEYSIPVKIGREGRRRFYCAVEEFVMATTALASARQIKIVFSEDKTIEFKGDNGFSCTIPQHAGGEVPWMKHGEKTELAGTLPAALVQDYHRACVMACKDSDRPNLNAIFFEHNGEVGTLAATDGKRLAVRRRSFRFSECMGVLLPVDLPLVTGDTMLTVKADHICFGTSAQLLWASRSRVTFPPWRQVLPAMHASEAKKIVVSRAKLVEAAAAFNAIVGAVSLSVGERLELSADNSLTWSSTLSDRQAHHQLDYDGGLEQIEPIAVNAQYLVEAVSFFDDDEVRLWWTGSLDPLVISNHDAGNHVIVMPMRV